MVRKAPPPEDPPRPAKKKGRPSLVDLQKRALILQQQQQQQPEVRHKTPNSAPPLRRSTRRNPLPSPSPSPAPASSSDDEDTGRRRQKKLKLVLENGAGDRGSDDRSDGDGSDGSPKEMPDSTPNTKGMAGAQGGEPSDSGPTTPLPDKKMLLFILDRLQKKDKYGVYSEPVDPEELPDYHEIIEHPMDFSTVRKKLSDGAYAHLEVFEKDIFLISSNAMRYNSPDTIYYRQARSIEELAKKSFEDLRQGNEEATPEVKVVRRGRPPGKSSIKRPVGRPPAEPREQRKLDLFTDGTSANATNGSNGPGSSNNLSRKGSVPNMLGFMNSNQPPQVFYGSENHFQLADHRYGKSEESSGIMQRGMSSKYGKKISVSEDNRRNTYLQPLLPTNDVENPILSTFRGEKKQLLPIGVFMEHAYARSLARFAANLGPIGWEIAAKRIERALPPGTKFGRGWIGEDDSPHLDKHQISASSSHPVAPSATSVDPDLSATEAMPKTTIHRPDETFEPSSNSQAGCMGGQHNLVALQKDAVSMHQTLQGPLQHNLNGFNRVHLDISRGGNMPIRASFSGDLRPEVPMTHAQLLDMVSRANNVDLHPAVASHMEADRLRFGNLSCSSNANNPVYSASDAMIPSTDNVGIKFSDSHVNHAAVKNPELERMNPSNAGLLQFGGSFMHLSTMGSADDRRFNNSGIINHGSGFLHSALGNHSAAEKSASTDPRVTYPCSDASLPVSRNIEVNHEIFANSSNNMVSMNHCCDKENSSNMNTPYSDNQPDSVRQPFQGPQVHHLKGDSVCPDLNSVFQTAGSQARGSIVESQKSDLALQL